MFYICLKAFLRLSDVLLPFLPFFSVISILALVLNLLKVNCASFVADLLLFIFRKKKVFVLSLAVEPKAIVSRRLIHFLAILMTCLILIMHILNKWLIKFILQIPNLIRQTLLIPNFYFSI